MTLHRPSRGRGQGWSWWRVAPLDSVLACAIVLVCLALCMQRIPPLLSKLRMVEVITSLPTQTLPLVEALAITGGLDTLGPTDPQPLARFRFGRQDGQAVAIGFQPDGQGEVRLGMRLAVQEPGLAWHTLPLCGLRQPPAGWRSEAQALASGLTDEQLPYACSAREGQQPVATWP